MIIPGQSLMPEGERRIVDSGSLQSSKTKKVVELYNPDPHQFDSVATPQIITRKCLQFILLFAITTPRVTQTFLKLGRLILERLINTHKQ